MSLLNRARRAAGSEFTRNYYDKEKLLGMPSCLILTDTDPPNAPASHPLRPRDVGGSWSAPPAVNPAIWRASHQMKMRNAKSATSASERQREENRRLSEDVDALTNQHQKNVDRRLTDRTCDVKFWRQELDDRHIELSEDVEALKTFRDRLENQHDRFFHPLEVAQKCIHIRNQKPGVENVEDEASTSLRQEVQQIQRCRTVLARIYKDTRFQIRQNLTCLYDLRKSIEDKRKAVKIDKDVHELTPLNAPLSVIPKQDIDPSPISVDDWKRNCVDLAKRAEEEHNLSTQLKSLAEAILTSTCRQVKEVVDHTNEAIKRRIDDINCAKTKVEEEHSEVVKEESELHASIADLEGVLKAKEEPLALAQNRVEIRRRRPPNEKTRDEVEAVLLKEIVELETSLQRLSHSLRLSKDKLDRLEAWKKSLEHDINLKIQALHLDEVQVMQLRSTVQIQQS